ncbi:MAG TPA: TraR/DksA C4-type zinc finger protein [Mycobacteriales bacterium]|nr:TraR/DksA C4-type zinc finger protein [Mycobacteriales bacterium]
MTSPVVSAHPQTPATDRLPEYRAVLEEQWRLQVADIVELSLEAMSPAAGEPDTDGSQAGGLHLSAQLIAAARQQLQETEDALARVDNGTYGVCGSCREPIAAERLEILPAARYCVRCQGQKSRR